MFHNNNDEGFSDSKSVTTSSEYVCYYHGKVTVSEGMTERSPVRLSVRIIVPIFKRLVELESSEH